MLKRLSDLEESGQCVNFALLKSTMIGNAVGKLRKSENEEVREKADEIVRKWKVQLGEEERRSAAQLLELSMYAAARLAWPRLHFD